MHSIFIIKVVYKNTDWVVSKSRKKNEIKNSYAYGLSDILCKIIDAKLNVL